MCVHTEVLGQTPEQRIEPFVAGEPRFDGQQQCERLIVVSDTAQEFEHQPKPPSFVRGLHCRNVTRKIAQAIQRLVGRYIELESHAGRCQHACEHGQGGFANSCFVGRNRRLRGVGEFRQSSLSEACFLTSAAQQCGSHATTTSWIGVATHGVAPVGVATLYVLISHRR